MAGSSSTMRIRLMRLASIRGALARHRDEVLQQRQIRRIQIETGGDDVAPIRADVNRPNSRLAREFTQALRLSPGCGDPEQPFLPRRIRVVVIDPISVR